MTVRSNTLKIAVKEALEAWDVYMNAESGEEDEFNVLGFAMERLRQAAKGN